MEQDVCDFCGRKKPCDQKLLDGRMISCSSWEPVSMSKGETGMTTWGLNLESHEIDPGDGGAPFCYWWEDMRPREVMALVQEAYERGRQLNEEKLAKERAQANEWLVQLHDLQKRTHQMYEDLTKLLEQPVAYGDYPFGADTAQSIALDLAKAQKRIAELEAALNIMITRAP